jgi:hypothetical protein
MSTLPSMKLLQLLAAALVAASLTAATAVAGDPTGTWKSSFTSPGGRTVESTLKFELKNGSLTGSVTGGRMGEAPISDASFKDDTISFSVTRERNGTTFITKYSGKLDGDTITGTIEMPAGRGRPGGLGGPPPDAEGRPGGPGGDAGPRKIEWHATRAK